MLTTIWRRLKPLLLMVSPTLVQYVVSYRFYQRCKVRFGSFQKKIRPILFGNGTPLVLSGPFQGLPYLDEIGFCGPIFPKWLGSYECELHDFWHGVLSKSPATIIDIGSAEGYYAVLLAAKLPRTEVHSFDFDPLAIRAQRRLAILNQVTNLIMRKFCDHRILGELLSASPGRSLIICDIEGAETELIDPTACPELLLADLLVELHESSGKILEEVIRCIGDRFSTTHTTQFIPIRPRNPSLYASYAAALSMEDLSRALDEVRGISRGWLALTKRAQHESFS